MTRALLLLSIAAALAGCGQKSEDAFDQAFDRNFVESCVSASTGRGVPAKLADEVCACGLKAVNAKYSTLEKTNVPGGELSQIMKACADEAKKTNG